MPDDQFNSLIQWYADKRPLYEGLTNIVQSTIESLIKNARIDYLSVTSRAKTMDSFTEKVQRKGYSKPEEITDLSGIRVITFIESDVGKVCELIKSSFRVNPSKSLDKTEELGIDKLGYRSVHFVCDLGDDRIKLPEFSLYRGLVFEIQVRTVLQHAWAEIEHDRNYKFSGVLPTPIQRRLHLLAGMLEVVDREFVSLASEIDKYAEDVAEKTQSGNLNVEINSTSLMQYLPERLSQIGSSIAPPISNANKLGEVIDELRAYGIHSLSDLERILNREFIGALKHQGDSMNIIGLLRRAMIYDDVDRYFSSAWQHHWNVMTDSMKEFIEEKYGQEKLKAVLQHMRPMRVTRKNKQLID